MKDKGTIITTFITVALVTGMVGLFLIGGGGSGAAEVANIVGSKAFDIKDRSHVKEAVKYEQSPPVGGNHDAVWAGCDGKVYDKPLRSENAVHSLEHGAVWITYKKGTSSKELNALKKKVAGEPYIMLSPLDSQSSQITLSAWNNQLGVTSANDARIGQFISAFSQSSKAPEPGASCTASPESSTQAPPAGGGTVPGESAADHPKENPQK